MTVSFEIQTPSKEVSLYPIQEGDLPSAVESVKIDLNRTKATITGVQSVLDKIDSIGIPVDVSQIQGTVKKFIDVPVSGDYQVNPKTVSAQVTPVLKTQDSETSSTNHSSSSVTEATRNSSGSSRSSETSATQMTSSQEEPTNQSTD